MNEKPLLLSVSDSVALLTINRPQRMNALDPDSLDRLLAMVIELEQRDDVTVVIITGAGEKAFVAGGDIAAMQALDPFQAQAVASKAHQLFNRIEKGRKVYIAAINGYALGGGCELVLACDLRIAGEGAKLGQPEINLGIIPGWGGTQRLTRLIGMGRAKQMMLTGRPVTAAQAEAIGLVNECVPADQLLEKAQQLAAQIAQKSPLTLGLLKDAINNGLDMDLDKALDYEVRLFGLCFASDDQKEGMQAFLDKRAPLWKNR